MKNYQNQLDRFRTIAKKLVDDHSAELFSSYKLCSSTGTMQPDDAYHSHLDTLGKQLDEEARQFITTAQTNADIVRSEVWELCKKYLDQFVRRNQPS
ncbi:MAG TPA: hypothetical protein VGD89_14455 [Flavipsychrobacter sp.]